MGKALMSKDQSDICMISGKRDIGANNGLGEEQVGLETGHEVHVVGKGPKGKVERGKLCQGRSEDRVKSSHIWGAKK